VPRPRRPVPAVHRARAVRAVHAVHAVHAELAARALLTALVALGAVTVIASCTQAQPASRDEPAGFVCDVGDYVFCRCADGEPGRRSCRASRLSFTTCACEQGAGPAGGEGGASPEGQGGGPGSTGGAGGGGAAAEGGAAGAPVATGGSGGTSGNSGSGGGGGGGSGSQGGVCGNAAAEPGEQCDDGNTAPGDGCDGACLAEADPPIGGCPGQPVHVFDDDTVVLGSTSAWPNELHGTCGGGQAGERVFLVFPHANGTLTASLVDATFDGLLYARAGCAGPELACHDAPGQGGDVIAFVVQAGGSYAVVVDGYAAESGSFALSLRVK
jgi:cysteine-rich repeat protein